MIGIKQTVNIKNTNTNDLIKTVKNNIKSITGWAKSACDIGVIKLGHNISVVIIRNIKLKKYLFITVGASNKDITIINKDLSESRYHYEYIIEVSGEYLNNKTASAIIKDYENNKTNKALDIIYMVALCAKDRDNILLDKMNFGVKTDEKQETPNVILTKNWENPLSSDNKNLELSVDSIGRVGKLKFIQVVVCNEQESKFVTNLEDRALASAVCISMFIDGKHVYDDNRTETFNFSNILPVDKLTDENIKELKLEIDKTTNLPIINEVEQFNRFLELLYNK